MLLMMIVACTWGFAASMLLLDYLADVGCSPL
jgi:uncharacterized membrane protein YwzB